MHHCFRYLEQVNSEQVNLKCYISGRNSKGGVIKKSNLTVSLYVFFFTLSKHLPVTIITIKWNNITEFSIFTQKYPLSNLFPTLQLRICIANVKIKLIKYKVWLYPNLSILGIKLKSLISPCWNLPRVFYEHRPLNIFSLPHHKVYWKYLLIHYHCYIGTMWTCYKSRLLCSKVTDFNTEGCFLLNLIYFSISAFFFWSSLWNICTYLYKKPRLHGSRIWFERGKLCSYGSQDWQNLSSAYTVSCMY